MSNGSLNDQLPQPVVSLILLCLALFSASGIGIGGFIAGGVLVAVTVGSYSLIVGAPSPLLTITISLIFLQGGFIVIAVAYGRFRRWLPTYLSDTDRDPDASATGGSPARTFDSTQSGWEPDSYDWAGDEEKGGEGEQSQPTAGDRSPPAASADTGAPSEMASTDATTTASDDTTTGKPSRSPPKADRQRSGDRGGFSRLLRSVSISPQRRQAGENGGGFHIPLAMPNRRDVAILIAGYVVALINTVVVGILSQQLSQEAGTEQGQQGIREMGFENPEILFLLLPAMILIVGPGEELLYRGVVQGRLREALPTPVAIGIASLIFGSIHIAGITGGELLGNLIALLPLVTAGIIFGVCYELSDNIVVPSLVHGFYNATVVLILIAAVFSGVEPQENAFLCWFPLG